MLLISATKAVPPACQARSKFGSCGSRDVAQSRLAKDSRELVLGIGMPAQAALDNGGVDREGLPGTGGWADLRVPVVRAEQARPGLRLRWPWRRFSGCWASSGKMPTSSAGSLFR